MDYNKINIFFIKINYFFETQFKIYEDEIKGKITKE